MKIFCFAILLTLISSVVSASLRLIASKTEFNQGESISLNAVFVLDKNEELDSVIFYYNDMAIAVRRFPSNFYLTSRAIEIFNDRIISFIDNSTNYVITINLRASDSGTYRVLLMTTYVDGQRLPFDSQIVIGVKVKNASLKFIASKTQLNEGESLSMNASFLLNENEEMYVLNFYYNGQPIAWYTGPLDSYITKLSRSKFGSRINLFIFTINNNYGITLDMRLGDSGTYNVKLSTRYKNGPINAVDSEFIVIEVTADPVVLNFPNFVLGTENGVLTFIATVFGSPKPASILQIEDETIIAESSIDLLNSTFNYIYSFTDFTPNKYCGKVFIFTVNGANKKVAKTAPIIFVPSKVNVSLLKQYEDHSVVIQWNKIVLGRCKFTYKIEFLNSLYNVIQVFDGISGTEFSATNSNNASLIKIYATIIDIAGEAVVLILPAAAGIPPPPAAKAIRTNNVGVSVGITFGVVAFIIVAGIIIRVVVKKSLPSKIAYNKLSSLGIILENQTENLMLTPDKTKKQSLLNNSEFPLSLNKLEIHPLPMEMEFLPVSLNQDPKLTQLDIPLLPNKTKFSSSELPTIANNKLHSPDRILVNQGETSLPPEKTKNFSLLNNLMFQLPSNNKEILSSPSKTNILPLPLNQIPALPQIDIPLSPKKTAFPSSELPQTIAYNKLHSPDKTLVNQGETSLSPEKTKNLSLINNLMFQLSSNNTEVPSSPNKTKILPLPLNPVPALPQKNIPLLFNKTERSSPVAPPTADNKLHSSDIIPKNRIEIPLSPDKTKNMSSNNLGFPLSSKKVEVLSSPNKTEALSLPLNQALPLPRKDIPLLVNKTEFPSPSKKI